MNEWIKVHLLRKKKKRSVFFHLWYSCLQSCKYWKSGVQFWPQKSILTSNEENLCSTLWFYSKSLILITYKPTFLNSSQNFPKDYLWLLIKTMICRTTQILNEAVLMTEKHYDFQKPSEYTLYYDHLYWPASGIKQITLFCFFKGGI